MEREIPEKAVVVVKASKSTKKKMETGEEKDF